MKRIQQKLREILGNTARVTKHLASGNLPTREEVINIWKEATGVVYSAKFTLNGTATPVVVSGSECNPLGATVVWEHATDGLATVTLQNLPAYLVLSSAKVIVKVMVQHEDIGANNVRVVGYGTADNTHKSIFALIETFLLSAINTLADTGAATVVYIEVIHI